MAAQFPDQVWDGLSASRERTDELQNPDTYDWAKLVEEIQATQQKVLDVEAAAGGGDAGDIDYAPSDAGDWDSTPDNVADALDNVASEVQDVQDFVNALPDPTPDRVTLTNDTFTEVLAVTLAPGETAAGVIDFSVLVRDATDCQAVARRLKWQAANKAGTFFKNVDIDLGTPALTDAESTLAVVAQGAGASPNLSIQLKATSSLTPTTLVAHVKSQTLGLEGSGPS